MATQRTQCVSAGKSSTRDDPKRLILMLYEGVLEDLRLRKGRYRATERTQAR
jgi:flagellin-specific chaperone FliS